MALWQGIKASLLASCVPCGRRRAIHPRISASRYKTWTLIGSLWLRVKSVGRCFWATEDSLEVREKKSRGSLRRHDMVVISLPGDRSCPSSFSWYSYIHPPYSLHSHHFYRLSMSKASSNTLLVSAIRAFFTQQNECPHFPLEMRQWILQSTLPWPIHRKTLILVSQLLFPLLCFRDFPIGLHVMWLVDGSFLFEVNYNLTFK